MIENDDLDDIVEATERILAAAPEGHRPSKVSIRFEYVEGSEEYSLKPVIDVQWYA